MRMSSNSCVWMQPRFSSNAEQANMPQHQQTAQTAIHIEHLLAGERWLAAQSHQNAGFSVSPRLKQARSAAASFMSRSVRSRAAPTELYCAGQGAKAACFPPATA
jgi:hypothetical protein